MTQQNKLDEIGTIKKDWGGRKPIALVYPNTYYVGMSNLAIHLLYRILNNDPRIVAERVFLSEDKILSEESKRPLSDFHIVAFTFSFETDYLNVPKLFGKDIPLLKKDRNESHPILIAGGPAVTLNPKALTEIFDIVITGEVEEKIDEIKALNHSSEIEGKTRAFVSDLNKYPTHTVIWTDNTEFGHMHLVEVARGCPWNCRFCATPPLYLPYRTRSEDTIWKSIEHGLSHRKHIGLVGSDVLGHPSFKEIANELAEKGIKVSTSSLRINWIDRDVANILKRSGHKRATLGIEAGTERLRNLLDKTLTDGAIFRAVKNLAAEGITNLKLYFMTGLPGETDDDLKGIASLANEIRKIILSERKSKILAPNISLVATPFVPKKLTSFENENFAGIKYLNEANKKLKRMIGEIPNTTINGESPKKAELEYKLGRAGPKELMEYL